MDRMADVGAGAFPHHHEWDWLWSTLAFCPDPLSHPPQDMSGWCWWPCVPVQANDGGDQRPNAYGAAMYFPNSFTAGYSHGWYWTDPAGLNIMGGHPYWFDHTMAFGWDHRGVASGNLTIARLYNFLLGGSFRARYSNVTDEYNWMTASGTLTAASGLDYDTATGNTFVATTRAQEETIIYSNGQPIASGAWGTSVLGIKHIWVGADYLAKENTCINGTVGPFLLSRHAWSESEVLQWSADPWGFIRADIAPILPGWRQPWEQLICDVQTRLAVAGDARGRPAVACDVRGRAAAIADLQARLAVTGDARARAAVAADARGRAAVAGDAQARAAILADARARAAVEGDAQARAAILADARARAAVVGDTQSRSAVAADARTQED